MSTEPTAQPSKDVMTPMDYYVTAALTGLCASSAGAGMSTTTLASKAFQIGEAAMNEREEYLKAASAAASILGAG